MTISTVSFKSLGSVADKFSDLIVRICSSFGDVDSSLILMSFVV